MMVRLLPDLRAVGVLGRREFRVTMTSSLTYGVVAVAVGLAAWILSNDVALVRDNGLLVSAAPLRDPLVGSMLVVSLFLALLAVLSVARDRDQGTLEVLFYGPVDEPTYLTGKLAGLLGAYVAALPILLAAVGILSFLTRFEAGPRLIAGLALSVIPAAEVVAVGIMVSVLASRTRSSVLLFLSVVALFVVVGIGESLVSEIEIEDPSSSILPLRDALATMDSWLERLSPFTYLQQTVERADAGLWAAAGRSLLISVAGAVVAWVVALVGLRWRGVRAVEE